MRLILLLVLFSFSSTLSAQFFGFLWHNPENYYTACLSYPSDSLYRVVNTRYPGNFSRANSQIRIYNKQLNLIDSIRFPSNILPMQGEPTKIGSKLFWPCTISDSINYSPNFPLIQSGVMVLDLNYKFLSVKKLSALKNTAISQSEIHKIGAHLFYNYRDWANGTTTILKLDSLLTPKDSLTLNTEVYDLQTWHNKLVLIGFNFASPCVDPTGIKIQKMEVDTNFNFLNCFTVDSLTTLQVPNTAVSPQKIGLLRPNARFRALSSTRYFILGMYDVLYDLSNTKQAAVNAVLNSNNAIINTSLISSTITESAYLGQNNCVELTGNGVVTVGSTGKSTFFNPLYPITKLFVNKVDSNGTQIWKKEFGGDMYYQASSIILTQDSGYLVCGLRYNQNAPTVPPGIMESYLLKLNKNGDITANPANIVEMSAEQAPVVFPNPTSNFIQINFPTEKDFTVSIYDVTGTLRLKEIRCNNGTKLSLQELPKGIYCCKISSRNRSYNAKVVVE